MIIIMLWDLKKSKIRNVKFLDIVNVILMEKPAKFTTKLFIKVLMTTLPLSIWLRKQKLDMKKIERIMKSW